MKKNDTLIASADGLGTQGEGIVRLGDATLFVPYLLPGERAELRVLKEKGGVGYGKIEEILTPAEERVRPRCGAFYKCGGCQLQHMRYRAQLRFKTALVENSLRKIGGIGVPVNPCERSEREYGYRNKLQLPIGRVNGTNVIGFYAERSHRIVDISECPIHPDWAEKVISALHSFMETCGLDGYDEETGKGQLRHIVVRELKNKYIVTLVTTVRRLNGIDYLLFLLDKIFPEYSFYLNFNDKRTNVVFGEEFELLKGKGTYESREGDIVYSAGANTFVQVNDSVRGKLYDKIVSLVGEKDIVLDCYAGGGLLTAMLAKKCRRAYGIEIVPEASECADRLAERNGLKNMKNVCGRVEEELSALLEREKDAVVVLDPPRAGVDRNVIRTLLSRRAPKILLVSCNPATLARDAGMLTGTLVENERGELVKCAEPDPAYTVELVQPFDMFPQTRHVETLVVLARREEGA